jgi:GTP cyclohydrolase II
VAVAPDARPEDLVSPGHIFPLRSKPGGVLQRTGQTEGSVDLARLAGLDPSGVICEIMNDDGTMARCLTGDTFLSQRCDCGPQLMAAMERIGREGHGVIIYMNQEGRGIGLRAKLMAYNLQDEGQDTVQANESLGFKPDLREYGIGAQILADLGLKRIRILTNNPKKIVGISGFGLEVVGREPLEVGHHPYNTKYLQTKAAKMGHLLSAGTFDEQAETGDALKPG